MIYRFKLICEGIPYNKVGSKQNGAPDPIEHPPKPETRKKPVVEIGFMLPFGETLGMTASPGISIQGIALPIKKSTMR